MRHSAQEKPRGTVQRPFRLWFLAGEAACELAAMRILIALVSPAKYGSILRSASKSPSVALPAARLSELIWAVEAAGRRVPRDIKCLPRALALQRMLRRRGAAAEVRFGARRVDGEFRAHAWLEYGGTVILGNLPDLQEYSVFSEWPAL